MSYFQVEGSKPAPGSTPGSGTGATPPATRRAKVESNLTRHKTLYLAGAGVGVVGLALFMSRGDAPADDGAEGDSATEYELDTRDTDLYNELQPELEQISDQIRDTRGPQGPRGRRGKPAPKRPRRKPEDRPKPKRGPKGRAARRRPKAKRPHNPQYPGHPTPAEQRRRRRRNRQRARRRATRR